MDAQTKLLQQIADGQARIEEKLDYLVGVFTDDGGVQQEAQDTGPDSKPLETGEPK